MAGWSLIYQMLIKVIPEEQLFSYSISHSIYVFFWFVLEGFGKGVCAKSANFFGSKQYDAIRKVIKSVVKLSILFALITSIFMIFYPTLAIFLFAKDSSSLDFIANTKTILFWAWIAIFVESLWWGIQNILVAAEDTHYTSVTNMMCFWIVSILPIYLFVFRLGWNVVFCWQVLTIDMLVRLIVLTQRYKQERWKTLIEFQGASTHS